MDKLGNLMTGKWSPRQGDMCKSITKNQSVEDTVSEVYTTSTNTTTFVLPGYLHTLLQSLYIKKGAP